MRLDSSGALWTLDEPAVAPRMPHAVRGACQTPGTREDRDSCVNCLPDLRDV
jgi:hypothetical protein